MMKWTCIFTQSNSLCYRFDHKEGPNSSDFSQLSIEDLEPLLNLPVNEIITCLTLRGIHED